MTGIIHVCPLSRLGETLAASDAGSVVTLLAREQRAGLPSLSGVEHLALDMSDIVAARDGHALPAEAHLADLFGFVRRWDRQRPLLMHCYAGVSRSTAACFAALCLLDPGADERVLASQLRRAAPSATPNSRIVALADTMLGRSGRMTAAITAIGRGRNCFEGEVFHLDVVGADQIPAYQL